MKFPVNSLLSREFGLQRRVRSRLPPPATSHVRTSSSWCTREGAVNFWTVGGADSRLAAVTVTMPLKMVSGFAERDAR
jgi:hypothetical protein